MLIFLVTLAAGYIFVAGYIVGFYERENYGGATWFDWLFAALWLPFILSYFSSVLAKKVIGDTD